MGKPHVLFVVGTRPDAIKSAPAVVEMQKYSQQVDVTLVSTGQHREMLTQALDAFQLKADYDLAVMKHGQGLAGLTASILSGLDEILEQSKPDAVVAQGDTTTTFCAGLSAFYRRVPFAHIEAGLRTETVWDPFPEEFNRRAISEFAQWNFAPTSWAAKALQSEGDVYVTGNTGIDAVMEIGALTQPHGLRSSRQGYALDHSPPGELGRAAKAHFRGCKGSGRAI